jgi:hypothetical protein
MTENRSDRAHEVVEHLQTAALEIIEALRALLDVAEEFVKDPGEAAAMASTLARARGRSAPSGGHEPSGVERIRVS